MILFISLKSRGQCLAQKQLNIPWPDQDYSFRDFFRKAYENVTRPDFKMKYLHVLRDCEARRDFHIGSLRQINHLIQFDPTPNLELNEVRCEIYKISVSFEYKRKSLIFFQLKIFDIKTPSEVWSH